MIPYPSLQALQLFNTTPGPESLSSLKCIPALYNALRYESWDLMPTGHFSAELLGVCIWLHQRSQSVSASLNQHPLSHPEPVFQDKRADEDWLQVTYGS